MMGHNPDVTMKPDKVLLDAREIAEQAAIDEAGADLIGAHMGAEMEDERVATHTFACANPAYVGWHWAVTLVRAPRSKTITVNEIVLLPGPSALTAPAWVPWSERVRPGDLGVGDVLLTPADDPRLVPGYVDDLVMSDPPTGWEVGLDRERVLSPIGRDDAADRWDEGDFGPESPMAKIAEVQCRTCGFLMPIGGPFGQAFGICANAMAPADGRVVSLNFGCGAHSQIALEEAPQRPEMARDELGWDTLQLDHS